MPQLVVRGYVLIILLEANDTLVGESGHQTERNYSFLSGAAPRKLSHSPLSPPPGHEALGEGGEGPVLAAGLGSGAWGRWGGSFKWGLFRPAERRLRGIQRLPAALWRAATGDGAKLFSLLADS